MHLGKIQEIPVFVAKMPEGAKGPIAAGFRQNETSSCRNDFSNRP